ncbi:MAG: hypothetical protein ACPHDO_04310, partial [Candidatus Poseidoniaceae archaeon]
MTLLHLVQIMLKDVINDLVDGECIISAALLDDSGFTIERTSIDLKPNELTGILEMVESYEISTIVTTEYIVSCKKFQSGQTLISVTPKNGNIGKARLRIEQYCSLIANYL